MLREAPWSIVLRLTAPQAGLIDHGDADQFAPTTDGEVTAQELDGGRFPAPVRRADAPCHRLPSVARC